MLAYDMIGHNDFHTFIWLRQITSLNVNTGLGNGLVPSGNKPVDPYLGCHMVSLGHNEFNSFKIKTTLNETKDITKWIEF